MIVRRNKIFSRELIKNITDYIFSLEAKRKDYVTLFEREIAGYLGVKHAALVSSGRRGLELIMEYFHFPANSQIIMPSYTLKDLPIIIKGMGYKPVFADVDAQTCNIRAEAIDEKITDRTALIVATHLFGTPCDMDKIIEIAKKRNIRVVEDCAHSLGVTYKSRKAGTLSDASFFSLEVTKPINTFGGGIIATDNRLLYEFVKNKTKGYIYYRKKLIAKVISTWIEDIVIHSPFYALLAFLFYFKFTKELFSRLYRSSHGSVRGVNSRYSNFQAYLGYKALQVLDKRNSDFIEKMIKFRSLLSKGISFPKAGYEHTMSFYFNLIKTESNCENIRKGLLKEGIDAGIKDELSDNCPLYFNTNSGDYPGANKVYDTIVQMPMSFDFNDRVILKLADKLNKAASKSKGL